MYIWLYSFFFLFFFTKMHCEVQNSRIKPNEWRYKPNLLHNLYELGMYKQKKCFFHIFSYFKIITNTIQNTISLTFEDILLQHLQTHHRRKYCICMCFLPVSILYFLRAFWPRCKYHLSLQQMIAENYVF